MTSFSVFYAAITGVDYNIRNKQARETGTNDQNRNTTRSLWLNEQAQRTKSYIPRSLPVWENHSMQISNALKCVF